jgi:uncharacterized protein (TIGR01777 family)
MNLVVTGATGFIGRRLVRRLLAAGHGVTALTRDAARAASVLPVRCACATWDPRGRIDAAALRGRDAVVHLAGEGVAAERWTPPQKLAIRESRVGGTRTLVQAIAALPAAERPRTLVAASAIGYYGDRRDEELDEDSPPVSDFLGEVCQAWEREVFAARAHGLRAAAVRIGVVLGKDGGALERILPPFRLGLGGRLASGRQWMSWVHVDDVVGLFAWALEQPEATGPINATAPTPVTNAEFTAALGRALHRPALLPVPAVAIRLRFGEMSAILLASQRVLPRAATRLGFAFRYPALAGALADLCRDFGHALEYEQWLPRAPEDVFPFFSDPYNLEKITPEFLRFKVLRTTTPQIAAGTCFDYRLALRGVPLRWRSRIDAWEPPRRFTDRQVRGPYRTWEHTHEFEPADGGTIVRDRVRYELPLGALGDLALHARVARDLGEIFAFRRRRLAEMFG